MQAFSSSSIFLKIGGSPKQLTSHTFDHRILGSYFYSAEIFHFGMLEAFKIVLGHSLSNTCSRNMMCVFLGESDCLYNEVPASLLQDACMNGQ